MPKNVFLSLSKKLLLLLFAGLVFVVIIIAYFEQGLPNVEALKTVQMQEPLRIYNAEGELIAEFGESRRIPLPLQEMPPLLIKAIIATEDQRYYEHPGIDLLGLLRAGMELVITGKKVQGGSTITMQVARNFFLTPEKTFSRKIREILLALKISRELDKDKVLELYLNQVYLGNRAHGVAAAAQIYYGKKLSELTLGEIATLAGLPKAPSTLNPLVNPKGAHERRDHVLQRMLEVHDITADEWKAALKEKIESHYHGLAVTADAPYAAEAVRTQIIADYGENAYNQGLKVYTTLSHSLQAAANQAVKKAVESYRQRHLVSDPKAAAVQAALVALNPQNGSILAWVGGYRFDQSQLNRVDQMRRQAGSSFKPFLYSAALDKNMTLATVINDAPFVGTGATDLEIWRPENDDRDFMGPISLRTALALSRNLVSVRILQSLGLEYVLDYIKRFGFDPNQLPHDLSLSLGSGDVAPLQMAEAFSVFANGGYRITPYLIDKIEDQSGKILYQAQPLTACEPCITQPDKTELNPAQPAPRVLPAQTAYLMTSALQSVIQEGTAQAAKVLGRADLAGKTGTPNDQRDAWFDGFNSDVVAIAWMGFDQPQSLHEYPVTTALPLWIDFMRVALENKPLHTMPRPPGLVSVKMSGNAFETFKEGTEPTTSSTSTNSGMDSGGIY